jgi:hypothetical protein
VISKLQYFPRFLTRNTRIGNLMPNVLVASDGVVINVDGRWVDNSSKT